MRFTSLFALALLPVPMTRAVDFKSQVAPVLKQYCYKCHSEAEKKEKGKLALDNLQRLGEKIGSGKLISPGEPDTSPFYTSMIEPLDSEDRMPPKKDAQPSEQQVELIKTWIAEGAKFEGGGAAPAMAPSQAAAPGGLTTWTSADGRTIQATMLRLEGDNVILQRNDGGVFSVPLANLSPESQAAAKGTK
ncbi:MAG: c-type cytochrome domain-containing protein [Roseimicrobium sp.]